MAGVRTSRGRRIFAAVAVLALATGGGVVRAESGPRFLVQSELAHGGNVVTVHAVTRAPYGIATVNGRRLRIECFQTGRAIYTTFNPLFPVVYANYYAMRGRLPNGQPRWIIGAEFAPIASLIVRAFPGSGPCGTDALASGNLSVGYVLIT